MSKAPARNLRGDDARPLALQGQRSPALRARRLVSSDGPAGSVRRALRVVPRAAWTCALIAFLNACAWSLITPPFQGRDEVDHFAYVAQIAETGTLPAHGQAEGVYSPKQTRVLEELHYRAVRFEPGEPTISTPSEQRALSKTLSSHASTIGSGEAGVATPEPPLFYAIQTIPYFIARGHMLTQLQLMRLVDALLGAVTALLCFLFVRETVPGVRWAATVGGLCVALQPMFAYMAGSVNPDVLLFTIGSAIFLCLARAFRRGLTWRSGLVLGLLTAAGFLTKLNFIGFAIGVFFGLCALAVRALRSRKPSALRPIALAAAVGFAPPVLYVLHNKLANHQTFGPTSENVEGHSLEQLFHEASYVWELFLPRLPGMPHYFKGLFTLRDVWFDRAVGFYGWMDVLFPGWVTTVALVCACATALLIVSELIARRTTVRERLPELATYAVIVIGVLVVIGVPSYHSDIVEHFVSFGEPRYLLPLLALLGAALALAVRGARRWAPVVGASLIVLFLAHDLFSQLQTIARYYG